ncbi:MAG: pirin family protein, partial [Bdellovibrionota bacterium]
VNLPKKDKMAPPGYQSLSKEQIPKVELPGGAGFLRVIAGDYGGAKGPARTFSPMNVWDLRLSAGARVTFDLQAGHTAALFVLSGKLLLPGGEAGEAELAVLEREGTDVSLEAAKDSKVLLLSGQPLGEPIVGYGPFVMSSEAEIRQAFLDYREGRMGALAGGGH